LGDRVLDAKVIDPSDNSTATAATVADVTNALYHVAHSVYKTDLLGLVEKLKSLFTGNIKRGRRTLEL
jgi:hypothetical protein